MRATHTRTKVPVEPQLLGATLVLIALAGGCSRGGDPAAVEENASETPVAVDAQPATTTAGPSPDPALAAAADDLATIVGANPYLKLTNVTGARATLEVIANRTPLAVDLQELIDAGQAVSEEQSGTRVRVGLPGQGRFLLVLEQPGMSFHQTLCGLVPRGGDVAPDPHLRLDSRGLEADQRG